MKGLLSMTVLLACVGCSVERGPDLPAFSMEIEEGNGLRIADADFLDFARNMADAPDAAPCIETLYDIADSLSVVFGDSETLECLSDQFASVFFNADSPYCDDRIYSIVLKQEARLIDDFPPYHKKMLKFRSDILSLGLPGTRFPYPCHEDKLNIIVVKSDDCAECEKLMRELSQSRVIRRAEKSGRLAVSVQTVSDGFLTAMRLDPRFIPSLYLVDSDGIIRLRACRSVRELMKSDLFLKNL